MNGFLKPGDMLLEYRLLAEIGQGGMGIVFKAVHEDYDDIVAIKVLAPRYANREDFAKRFKQECKFYPKLKHQHIVRMRRAGVALIPVAATDPSEPPPPPLSVAFVVMDLLEGKTLRKILAKYGRLDFLNALHVMIQIADAMRLAHFKGIVHRDLKPENIMVGTIGDEKGYVWVMDFGIAMTDDNGMSTADMPDMGTARYMAPEQVRNIFSAGKKEARVKLDHRIDIYAFGLIFYECLTGVHTFINDADPPAFEEMLAGHLVAEPTPVHHLVFDCPDSVWPILERCLAIDPERRYQSFDDVLDDLRAIIRESVPPTHVLAKRAAAERERHASRAAFASLPAAPSKEGAADLPSEPSRREALTPELPESSGREALTPEPPAPVEEPAAEDADIAPQSSASPKAAASTALAPSSPAVGTRIEVATARIEVAYARIEVPSEAEPETTREEVGTEPQVRLTLPLLNYVPKASPLPFVEAAAPFVPSVPLLQPKRGVGYTTKLQRPEIPGLDTSQRVAPAGANPPTRPPEPPSGAARSAAGLPPPVMSAAAAFALPSPLLPPPWTMPAGRGPELPHAAARRPPARVSFGTPPPIAAAPAARPPAASSAGGVEIPGPSASTITRPNSTGQSPPLTARTSSTMTSFSRLSRRRLIFAPVLGLAIVLAGSMLTFFLARPQTHSAQAAAAASASSEPTATAVTPSAAPAPPRAVASTGSAPSAMPALVPVAVATRAEAPQPVVVPASQVAGAPVPAMTIQPTSASTPKPPNPPHPPSVAHRPPSRTPVIPLVGD